MSIHTYKSVQLHGHVHVYLILLSSFCYLPMTNKYLQQLDITFSELSQAYLLLTKTVLTLGKTNKLNSASL